MTDLAQLQVALEWFDDVGGEYTDVLKVAAKELLSLREAGALIITPDENGEWPGWVHRAASEMNAGYQRATSGRFSLPVMKILDALRDAMPDGDS